MHHDDPCPPVANPGFGEDRAFEEADPDDSFRAPARPVAPFLWRHSVSCQGRPRRRPGDRSQIRRAVLPDGATLPRLSDTGRATGGCVAAPLVLAGLGYLASAGGR